MTDWCIMRMAGPRTLPLVRSLTRAGLTAWSPIEQVERGRGVKKRWVDAPMMPTFAFGDYDQLPLLLGVAKDPLSPHPPFSILKFREVFPRVAEADLTNLRRLEENATRAARIRERKEQPAQHKVGETVRVPEGAFAGLDGVVLQIAKGKDGLVAIQFPGFKMPVKVPGWALAQIGTSATTSLYPQPLRESSSNRQENRYKPEQDKRAPRHRNAAKYLGQ